ncbi:MAG: peptide deformylase [Chloroflexota bacterium]|nr:peptide deformylase [Chloroflexota bacterium]
MRRILELPDPVLREVADPVPTVTPEVAALVDDMFATMHANLGIGLAAPQVGELLRLVVIELPPNEKDPQAGVRYVLINPELRRLGERESMSEGCLSLPGYRAMVERAHTATVTYTGLDGRFARLDAQGLLAQALQHEIDHLNGVLFIDHLDSLDELEQIPPDGLDWVPAPADEDENQEDTEA